MINYEDMNINELEQVIRQLGDERRVISDQMKAVQAVLSRKRAEQAAAAQVAGMSGDEREALRQVLQADGIASDGVVGMPGAQ